MVLDASILPWAALQALLWLGVQIAASRLWWPAAAWGALAAQAAASLGFWLILGAVDMPRDDMAAQWAGTAALALAANTASAFWLARG